MSMRIAGWAFAAATVLFVIAMLRYPGGSYTHRSAPHYSVFENSVSDLGMERAWNGTANSRATFFAAIALGLSSFLIAFVALARAYSSSGAGRIAVTAGLVACLAFVAATLAPWDRYRMLHGRLAMAASIAFFLSCAFFAIAARQLRLRARAQAAWWILTVVMAGWIVASRSVIATSPRISLVITLQKVVAIAVVAVFFIETFELRYDR